MYDVVTLGETMVRLTPATPLRLEQALALEVHVGGSESNTAVGLARLGVRVCWLSRLTDNPMGKVITNTLRAQGVDTSRVVWTADDRVGLYFLEEGAAPRESRVIYDRKLSAISRMQADELPVDLFRAGGARLLHLTGITLALGEAAYATCARALELAQAAGWKVSFDVNYRGKLWTLEAARTGCERFMQAADVIFLPLRDALNIYGYRNDEDAKAVLDDLGRRYPQATVAMTLGEGGALARRPDGAIAHHPIFQAAAVSRLGRGDAFTAGFLYRWLEAADDIQGALRWGTAMAALKYGITGDMPLVEKAEAQALVERGALGGGIAR